MSKRHIILFLFCNVALITIGCFLTGIFMHHDFQRISSSLNSAVGETVSHARVSDLNALESALVQTIASAQSSVVSITISKDVKFYMDDPSQIDGPGNVQQQTAKIGGGSGIIVSKQGYILTNKHVVQDTSVKYAVTLQDGRTYNVHNIRFDDMLDLAILSIVNDQGITPDDLMPASFLSFQDTVHIGQLVIAIGNSLSSYTNNVTLGIIGGKGKSLTLNKNNTYIGLYQTDALVNPGNSGGPLLDINGKVLGITTAIVEGEGIAFVLPISKEFLESTLASIKNFGKIIRPIVGIQYTDIGTSSTGNGILIKDVLTDLPAWNAGLKIDDIVVGINNITITSHLPFLYQLYTYLPGDHITLDIIRAGKKMSLSLVLGGTTP